MCTFSISITTDANSSVQYKKSSPKIESVHQVERRGNAEIVRNERNIVKRGENDFIFNEFDQIHFLCKIAEGCFPEPRILFYNKKGKRMQNNENIQIGKTHIFKYD